MAAFFKGSGVRNQELDAVRRTEYLAADPLLLSPRSPTKVKHQAGN